MSGVDLLDAIKAAQPEVEVVLMTAYGTVETAVTAMKRGAYDFVEKPVKRQVIVKTVRKALEKRSLVVENRALKNRLLRIEKRSIIGNAPAFRRTMEVALQAAPSAGSTVLVTPLSSAMICWVRSAIRTAFSEGSASASSMEFV